MAERVAVQIMRAAVLVVWSDRAVPVTRANGENAHRGSDQISCDRFPAGGPRLVPSGSRLRQRRGQIHRQQSETAMTDLSVATR
jgi:hypothetical protein